MSIFIKSVPLTYHDKTVHGTFITDKILVIEKKEMPDSDAIIVTDERGYRYARTMKFQYDDLFLYERI
jgi:hypothetical protein